MGESLGNLGRAIEPLDTTFEYFGSTVRVNPEFCELDLIDFIEATSTVDENSPQAVTMMKEFFRVMIHPEDFSQFWSLAKKNRQGPAALAEVSKSIVEGLTGRPTSPPSDSSPGRRPTVTTSTVDVLTDFDRAMEDLRGRPDLQFHVYQAQQASTETTS